MLPTRTEIKFAQLSKFDVYSITNFSFFDIAIFNLLKPSLYAVVKKDLSDRAELSPGFRNPEYF